MIEDCIIVIGLVVVVIACVIVGFEFAQLLEGRR